MTDQIKDVVRFRGQHYFVAVCSIRAFPFYPQDEGLGVIADSTDNSRGFHAQYTLNDTKLILTSVAVSLSRSQYRDVLEGKSVRLFGVDAIPALERRVGAFG